MTSRSHAPAESPLKKFRPVRSFSEVSATVCHGAGMTTKHWLPTLALLALTAGCGGGSSGTEHRTAADPPRPTPPPAGDFVKVIDNPWMPWRPGTVWHFIGQTADGTERTVVTVTHRTRVVQGVRTRLVHDVVHVNGKLLEDTFDYYAQDKHGNVWYFGEDTKEYDGSKVDSSGSWEAGVDGARAGIAMEGSPEVGDRYFQEYYPGEAMDQGKVLATGASVTVPYGSLTGLLKTKDFTRLEPKGDEHKYYKRGVGVVLENSLYEKDTTKLVSMQRP
jgi:hypothetical protein